MRILSRREGVCERERERGRKEVRRKRRGRSSTQTLVGVGCARRSGELDHARRRVGVVLLFLVHVHLLVLRVHLLLVQRSGGRG